MAELSPNANTELYGHEATEALLAQEMASGKLPHGLILAGARGIGKATCAYRLARRLLAGEGRDVEAVFRRIAAGSHADLLVIEQAYDEKKEELANEISVEQARGIGEFLALTPGESDWRVVIVDSIDAMNLNAANAILKILEEPPPQAMLILISHNPGRLLPTIRSRCRMLKLAPLGMSDFTKVIRHVAPSSSHEEIAALAIVAAGSPGKALAMKEQGALERYQELLEVLVPLPAIAAQTLHAFAESMGTGQIHANWQLVTELMLVLIERIAKTAAGITLPEVMEGEARTIKHLAALHPAGVWAAKWQQCADQFLLAQSRHLDYKQVLITYIHSLAERNSRALLSA